MSDDKTIREKLVARGVSNLTDAELMAVLFQSVRSDNGSFSLAREVISCLDGKVGKLSQTDMKTLRNIAGIGYKRAAMLAAAAELGVRITRDNAAMPVSVTATADVLDIFRPLIGRLPHEEFWALYLSGANTVLDRVRLSQGGASGTVVDIKLIVKKALDLLASGIILVHNHPSGVASPSGEDRDLTDKISRAASLFEIRLLDHVIITAGSFYSFKAEGALKL